MARLSKTSPFQIYNDGNTTSEATQRSDFDENVEEQDATEQPFAWTKKDDGFVTESSDEERHGGNDDGGQEGDDEKNYTRTSISSFPESSYPTDYERTPMHKPYTPQYARPSSRRMQLSSPLRKGKFGTPYSEPRGSPRSRRKDFDAESDLHEPKRFPLILLHITALPLNISWTHQSMRETLPQQILDNLQLLKSKLSATVLKRGILIPHPRDDYELLEEKLLEALDLEEPRISKCGHYRNRHSTDSDLTTATSSTDSGVGSSVEDGSDDEHCSTCHHHLLAAGSGKQKWAIKVYAANGLMRASAWQAAWSEMERVDVEIMPWIKDELRIKLDEANTQELVVAKVDPEADELRINQLVEERLRLLEQDSERAREAAMSREIERIVINEQRQFSQAIQEATVEQAEATKRADCTPTIEPTSTELPNIYRPKDIPLSILLWNYVFLLARKPKNMAIFFLVVLVTGLLAIVGPAPMAASVVGMSALVTSKTSNMGLPWVAPKTNEKPVLSIPEVPARGQSELEVFSNVGTEAQDSDTVTVSDSAVVSKDSSSASIDELGPDDAHAHAEHVDDEIIAAPEAPAEQAFDGEDVADEATQPQIPEMVVSSDSPADSEVTESTSVESVQAEQAEDHIFEQSDEVEIEMGAPVAPEYVEVGVPSIPVEPEDVEIEVANTPVDPIDVEIEVTSSPTEEEDSFVAPDSPKIQQIEKSAPQPFLSESPAVYSLVDEDGEGNDEPVASSPSHVGQMHQSLLHSVLSEQQETCRM
ncbi:hypothetical protein MBLNU13_g11192t1 [Cladosporium sp. NU13]